MLNWQRSVNRGDYQNENGATKIKFKNQRKADAQLKEQADDVTRLWEKASYFTRHESRAAALGGLSFLRLIGVEWDIAMSEDQPIPPGLRLLSVDEVRGKVAHAQDVFARMEHLRWTTYMFTKGIRTWNLSTPKTLAEVIKEAKATEWFIVPNSLVNQIDAFRAHAALIPFDQLPELDAALAHAVNPNECAGLTSADFVGTNKPDIGSGRRPSSLQGMVLDMWAILPDAMDIAGIRFFERIRPGDKVVPRMKEIAAPGRIRVFIDWLRGVHGWFTRKPADRQTEEEREQALVAHLNGHRVIDRLVRSAKWAQMVYENDVQLPKEVNARPYGDFLKSSFIDCSYDGLKGPNGEPVTAFMFDDLISPHSYWKRSMALRQTYLPYYFNPKNGLILPLDQLPKETRAEFKRRLGITARRVLFQNGLWDKLTLHRQPDFAAQVFSFYDYTEIDVERIPRIAIVFRGSATFKDWLEDIIQCFGLTPPQFRLAADLVRAVCETTDRDVVLIGHSEGGGEVQYALVKNSLRCWTGRRSISGVTINSQRLSPRLLNELRMDVDEKYAEKHIVNYRTGPDIVSGWKALGVDLLGTVYTIGKDERRMGSGIKAHLIDGFISELEKRLKDFE